jgi:hypothetical protein
MKSLLALAAIPLALTACGPTGLPLGDHRGLRTDPVPVIFQDAAGVRPPARGMCQLFAKDLTLIDEAQVWPGMREDGRQPYDAACLALGRAVRDGDVTLDAERKVDGAAATIAVHF